MFAHAIPFAPEDAATLLAGIPAAAGVFALDFGAGPDGTAREPYLSHSADLRRRLRRILAPAEGLSSRRVHLLPFVRAIRWTTVGSPFESDLLFYRASVAAFGPAAARKRLRLRTPLSLRLLSTNDFPRLVLSHKLVRSAAASSFGPFPSRAAAEKALEAVLDLFQLRRCIEDLQPFPEHPACLYAEMKKCLAPCNQSSTPERYRAETTAVFDFLRNHGRSLLAQLEAERAAASEALEFEAAAGVHARIEKVTAAVANIPETVQQLSSFSAVVVQPAATPGEVALFALRDGRLAGPVAYSTLGMRLHNEGSGSSSLFSHPVALEPVPLESSLPGPIRQASQASVASPSTLEDRLEEALAVLDVGTAPPAPSVSEAEDYLSLFTRWCYRPGTRRVGEALFPDQSAAGAILRKPLLRAISRTARAAALREAAAD